MRILLVHAAFPRTYWGFQHALAVVGKRATLPPLGLVTVAAHLPRAWELRLCDLNVEPLTDAALAWADAVLVGGMLVQAPSMHEVLARARRAGKRTVVGGPAASTSPAMFAADAVFRGEVEGRERELCAAITGAAADTDADVAGPGADAAHRPDLAAARVPRFDLLRLDAYTTMAIQTSRGCPYHCEFCDVIELFGRVPRVKPPAQVVAELDALHRRGWRGPVFVVDDNFIGNLKLARALLPAIRDWQRAHDGGFDLYTEASVNLASDPALLATVVEAGFTAVFVGIETPSRDALRAAGKTQNLKLDLAEAVARITAAGLEVMGGFIVGLDGDGPETFAALADFLADAPVPMAMIGVLTALPGTALARRLRREGRLRTDSGGDQFARPNFEPAMDEHALLDGYARLMAEVYAPAGYVRRCAAFLRSAPLPAGGARAGRATYLARAIWHLGVRGAHRRMFWQLVGLGARRGSVAALTWAVVHAIQGEHLVRYTAEDVLPRVRAAAAAVTAERAARAGDRPPATRAAGSR
jgi:radical SAM superfamily enzyme YgiQ (UPF0313 family)